MGLLEQCERRVLFMNAILNTPANEMAWYRGKIISPTLSSKNLVW